MGRGGFAIWMILLFAARDGFAFPEMTRHGYTQCTACHVSPGGGGVMTQYGRQLSEELLSTWSRKGEGQVLHGALKSDTAEKGFLIGGDVRSIQIHRKDANARSGRYFLMQANVDLAYQSGIFTTMISVGQIENPMGGRVEGNLNAGKFYLLATITEALSVRVGRFAPQFGINMPDHVLVTKQGLGFRPQMQYDTAELSWLSENLSFFGGVAKTAPGTPQASGENIINVHANYNFKERFKIGASNWYGEGPAGIRRLYGLNAILGFTHKLFNLTEIDFANDKTRDGLFAMSRVGYELFKGLVPYVQLQRQHADFTDRDGVASYYTLGGQFFPRPHFELTGQWSKVRNSRGWSDDAYLLVHYYF